MKTKYFLVNKYLQPLSSFDDNNTVTNNQLKFRTRDCITFRSKKEAQARLDYIKKTIRKGSADTLTISDYAKF